MAARKVIYVAQIYGRPAISAETFEDLEMALDNHYGSGPNVKNLGYNVSNAKYPDSFEGYFQYQIDAEDGTHEIERADVFCIEFTNK